ncbi:MAG: HAMP domain-containing sensor histidine kinase, partial [Elusimicrobiota bacterium]
LLAAVIIAACFIGYFLAQNLTAPILRLTEASRNIAAGNFDIKPVSRWLKKAKFKDEIVELSNTFSLMTRQLKRYTEMQADKMNAILFSIADGIIMTDYSGNIMLSNKKAGQLLGLDSNEELEGKKIQDIIQRQTISESLREVRKKREPVVKELDLSHENISKYLRTDTSIVSQAESDQDLGTVTVIRDITLEKELEQLKDDFVHSITHDLRSPMTSIRGFLEFLLDGSAGEINEQQKEFLQIIDRSSKRLLNMISDILDVAKMKSGNMPMEIDQVNIRQIATNVIDTMSSQAKKDKVSLSLIEKNEIKDINADNSLVGRVLTNLISNALKFTPEDGEIKVELSDEGDKIKVAVEDNGSGMPKEMCEKIFDKFEQVKGSKSKRKGTGLGLTITRYIVEAHEGKIYADSEPGKGTRVEFWIPRGLKIKES